LLDEGLDSATPGRYGGAALGGTDDEDIAMMLLEAGTPLSMMDSNSFQFRRYAEYKHWQRVTEWLAAHGTRAHAVRINH